MQNVQTNQCQNAVRLSGCQPPSHGRADAGSHQMKAGAFALDDVSNLKHVIDVFLYGTPVFR